jgi:hypothetical protein
VDYDSRPHKDPGSFSAFRLSDATTSSGCGVGMLEVWRLIPACGSVWGYPIEASWQSSEAGQPLTLTDYAAALPKEGGSV